MGALAFARTDRGWEDAGGGGGRADGSPAAAPAQPRLFALPGGALEAVPTLPPEVAPAPVALGAPARAVAAVRTLDDVLCGAFAAVGTGRAAECPVCAGPLRPRWSAGAGAVGGRCGDCGSSLD